MYIYSKYMYVPIVLHALENLNIQEKNTWNNIVFNVKLKKLNK